MSTKKSAKPTTKPISKTPAVKPKSKPAAKTPVKSASKPAVKSAAPSRATKTPVSTAKIASPAVPANPSATSVAVTPRASSKQSQLLALLRTRGATIPQMCALTGWQAHTIRATLSAVFRKRLGLTIESSKVEGTAGRMYRITDQAAA